jgi:hypothetical protein
MIAIPLPAASLVISYKQKSLSELHSTVLMVAYGAVLELIFVDSGKVLVIMITDS